MIGNKYHFEGKDKNGKAITIDLADLDSIGLDAVKHKLPYELIAFRPNTGAEIECYTFATLEDAAISYNNMIDRLTLKDGEKPPLKGRYAILRDDLTAAMEIGRQAAEGHDDGGTCNFDSPAIALPRWKESLVEQAAAEAGTHCFKWTCFGNPMFVFSTPNVGQANRNSIAAEAMTKYLKERGYDTFCYQQAD